jgi:hypothetical protein
MAKSLIFLGRLGNAKKSENWKNNITGTNPARLTRGRKQKQIMQASQKDNHLVTLDVECDQVSSSM